MKEIDENNLPSSRKCPAVVTSAMDNCSDSASTSSDNSLTSGDLEFSDSDFDFTVSPRVASLQQDYMAHLRKLNVLHTPEPLDAQRRYNRQGNVIPVFMQTRVRDLDLDEKYNRPTELPSSNVLSHNSPPVFMLTRKPPVSPSKTTAQNQAEVSAKLEATATGNGVQKSMLRGRVQICQAASPPSTSMKLSLKSKVGVNKNSESHQLQSKTPDCPSQRPPEESSLVSTSVLPCFETTTSGSDSSKLSMVNTPPLVVGQLPEGNLSRDLSIAGTPLLTRQSSKASVPSLESRANMSDQCWTARAVGTGGVVLMTLKKLPAEGY